MTISGDSITMAKANTATKTRLGVRPWIVCFSAALFFFYEFIQMNMFSAIDADLMRDFHINAHQLGYLSAVYFYSNVIFLFFAGMLLDRFSTRRIIFISLAICAGGTLAFALATNYYLAAFFRFLTGIGSAFCFLSCIRLASRWFPANMMALVSGLIVTMAMTGGMVAQTPLTMLVEKFGWRQALIYDAALGVVILAIIMLNVRNYPVGYAAADFEQHKFLSELGYWRSFKLAYFKVQNWLCGIYSSLLNLSIFLLGAIWGSLYLMQIHHFTHEQATYPTSLIFTGTILGAPLMGWLSDRMGRRKPLMLLGAVLSLALVLAVIYIPNLSLISYSILFFLLGLTTSTQVISYPTVTESSPKIITATAVSVVSLCCIGGGAIFQPLFGWLMDLSKDAIVVNGVHVYTLHDYHMGLAILPIAFLIALLAAIFIKETRCQPLE
ncbi:MAG: Transporter, superfamily [Gammaproteobacteria bacterium]|jgi:MFS family permease|nr:Transporter, superfamily [Gammaproteobacteria bacterium]